jgi:flagellar biosynthesis protein FliQ
VGTVISVLQVATQIQESSLTYVPKIVGAVIVLIAFGPWMLKRLAMYATQLYASIPFLL